MKTKIIYILLLACINICYLYPQSANKNYIMTRTFTNDAGTTYLDQIKYFNGLGYLEQTTQKNTSPTSKDWVILREYAISGRDSTIWLPAIADGNNGAYIAPATIKSKAMSSNGNDQNPYKKYVYNYSSLEHTINEYNPGQSWQTAYKNNSSFRTCNYGTYPFGCLDLYVQGNTIKSRGYLTIASIYLVSKTGEGYEWEIEYKNKKGQITLVKRFSMGVAHSTYYLYDDYGNLLYVLPPKASDLFDTRQSVSESDADAADLIYSYRYDKRNRCI
ncbi:DUF6443 domain-containing protein [Dysgonomonas sp. OttesenSCG-928-D17]|nr:DUF6443 domain-containing protein [Dysgonomonas sp. OttesenSCG-928-D17]